MRSILPSLLEVQKCYYVCVSRLQALMSLFVLASKDGWVNIMYHGLDAVGIDQQVSQEPRVDDVT